MVRQMENKVYRLWKMFEKITGNVLDIQKYEHRLMLQKIVYLIQKAEGRQEYLFSWYLKGPYSGGLTSDYFNVIDKQKTAGEIKLTTKEEAIVKSLRKNFAEYVIDEKGLELLGSLVFVILDMNVKQKNAAIEKLHSLKPWFSNEEIAEVYDKVKKSSLVS